MKFDMPECGGCRTCEIACSYHHTGGFAPSVSSIKILDKEDGAGYHVLFIEQEGQTGKACDLCPGLDVPCCVEFCESDEELRRMLKELSTTRKLNGGTAHPGGSA
jgi:Fe-S-cluster-containing hydrogenase component 2